jgi:hypothetical protein
MLFVDKTIAYRLERVKPSKGGIATACVMDCMVTGKMLSGSGGGSEYLAPEVVDILRYDKEVQALIQQKIIDIAAKTH